MKTFILLLAIIMCQVIAFSQWQQTMGPCGGYITYLTVDSSNVFAGTKNNGIFLSTDYGVNWKGILKVTFPDAYHDNAVTAIAINGTRIFAYLNSQGLFRSMDYGNKWSTLKKAPEFVKALTISGANIFAGTGNGGIFISKNNGNSWTALKKGPASITTLAAMGSLIFAGTTSDGVFLSKNNGDSWESVKDVQTNGYVSSLTISGSTIYAVIDGDIYYSMDNGNNWSFLKFSPGNAQLLTISGKEIFVATSCSLYNSLDNGINWVKVNSNWTIQCFTTSATIGSNIFVGTNGDGIFLSTDNRGKWSSVNNGLVNTNIFSLAINGEKLYAGTQTGLFLSKDNGNSWIEIDRSLRNLSVASILIFGSKIFASYRFSDLYHSTDDGKTWVAANLFSGGLFQPSARDESQIVVGAGTEVYLSVDNGNSWTSIRPKHTRFTGSTQVVSLAISGKNIFIGTLSRGIFASMDSGKTWYTANNGLDQNNSCYAMLINGGTIFAGLDEGVFSTTDNGMSWKPHINSPDNILSLAICGANIFAGTERDGLFISSDYGDTWKKINEGLRDMIINAIGINETHIFVGTHTQAVWKRSLSDLIEYEYTSTNLISIYPNPVSNMLNIYIVGDPHKKDISIINTNGILVKSFRQIQTSNFELNTSEFLNGVYFIQVQSSCSLYSKKFIVLR